MEFSGEVSAEDWRLARRAVDAPWWERFSGAIFISVFGLGLMLWRCEARTDDVLNTVFWTAMMGSDKFIDAWAFRGWLKDRAGVARFRFEPFEFEVCQQTYRWSQLERVIETKDYFVLGSGPCYACVIPRRLMDAETEVRWRELAAAELATMGKRIEVRT